MSGDTCASAHGQVVPSALVGLGCHAIDRGRQLLVRHRIVLVERGHDMRDAAVRPDHDNGPAVDHVVVTQTSAERGVRRPVVFGITQKEIGEVLVPEPGGPLGRGVVGDAHHDHVPSFVEQTCVLITVRSHLNCSATRSNAKEEREDDRFTAIVAQADGVLQDSMTSRAGKREVGSHLAHGQKTVFLSTGVDRAAHHERPREKRDT